MSHRNEILVIIAGIIAMWLVFKTIQGLIDWLRRQEMKRASAAPPPPKNKCWSKEAWPNEFLKLGARGVLEAATTRRKDGPLLLLGGNYQTWFDVTAEKQSHIDQAEAMWPFDPKEAEDRTGASNRVMKLVYAISRASSVQETQEFEQELALTLVFLLRIFGEQNARIIAKAALTRQEHRRQIDSLYDELITRTKRRAQQVATQTVSPDSGLEIDFGDDPKQPR